MLNNLRQIRDGDVFTRLAALAWALVLVFICVRCAFWPRVHSVYPIYSKASQDWVQGRSLYFEDEKQTLTAYRYCPFTVILLMPLHILPEWLGGIAERLLGALVFLLAIRWWLNRAVPHVLSERQKGIIFLLSVPLTVGSLNNGQLNLLVMGLLIAAAAATVESRWWLAGIYLALATGAKIYPLSVGLLLLAMHPRRLAVPLIVSLLCVAGLPFLCQWPDYVLGQYLEWYRVLAQDDRKFFPPGAMYRDLWLILRDMQVPITVFAYGVIQLGSAAGCALLCLAAQRRGWSRPALASLALITGTCWMMVCGPATEPCTYAMLAPVIAYVAVVAIQPEAWPRVLRYLPAAACATHLLLSFTGVLPPGAGLKTRDAIPASTLLLMLAHAGAVLFMLRGTGASRSEATAPVRRAA
jgi:hypothetical protein